MANLTKAERKLKADALWAAYGEYLEEGNDFPSQDMVTARANERDEIKACDEPIGTKTLAQSKNSHIKELRETMNHKKERLTALKAIAPTELSIKIEQLHSSLAVNTLLAEKIESLNRRLKNKDDALEKKDNRIFELSNEIRRLRDELKQIRV